MKLVSFDAGNDLSLVLHQAITWTNADSSSIGRQGMQFSEILIKIESFSTKNIYVTPYGDRDLGQQWLR